MHECLLLLISTLLSVGQCAPPTDDQYLFEIPFPPELDQQLSPMPDNMIAPLAEQPDLPTFSELFEPFAYGVFYQSLDLRSPPIAASCPNSWFLRRAPLQTPGLFFLTGSKFGVLGYFIRSIEEGVRIEGKFIASESDDQLDTVPGDTSVITALPSVHAQQCMQAAPEPLALGQSQSGSVWTRHEGNLIPADGSRPYTVSVVICFGAGVSSHGTVFSGTFVLNFISGDIPRLMATAGTFTSCKLSESPVHQGVFLIDASSPALAGTSPFIVHYGEFSASNGPLNPVPAIYISRTLATNGVSIQGNLWTNRIHRTGDKATLGDRTIRTPGVFIVRRQSPSTTNTMYSGLFRDDPTIGTVQSSTVNTASTSGNPAQSSISAKTIATRSLRRGPDDAAHQQGGNAAKRPRAGLVYECPYCFSITTDLVKTSCGRRVRKNDVTAICPECSTNIQ